MLELGKHVLNVNILLINIECYVSMYDAALITLARVGLCLGNKLCSAPLVYRFLFCF